VPIHVEGGTMAASWRTRTRGSLSPAVLSITLLLGVHLLPHAVSEAPDILSRLDPVLMALIGGAGALLFHQSRLFIAQVALLCFYWGASGIPTPLELPTTLVSQALISVLPLSIITAVVSGKRSVLSPGGFIQLAFVAAPVIGCVYFIVYAPEYVQTVTSNFGANSLGFSDVIPYLWCTSIATLVVWFAWTGSREAIWLTSGMTWIGGCFVVNSTEVAIPCATVAFLWTLAVIDASHRLAFVDDLTGLPGRRALLDKLNGLSPRNYSVAIVDIDNFKRINDSWGHDAGDRVLSTVAVALTQVSGGGEVYRMGGEEFAIVFSGLKSGQAATHVDRLRKQIERRKMKVKSNRGRTTKNVNVTFSAGVAARTRAHRGYALVLKDADRALYQAKKRGRNRICQA